MMKLWKKNLILIIIAAVIAAAPLFLRKGAEFSGADSLAEQAISEIDPEYEAWFAPVTELPGSEVESFLFALQAAIGAGAVGFILGRLTANKKKSGAEE